MGELKEIPRTTRAVDLGELDKDYAGTVVHVRSNLSTGALERLDGLQNAKDMGPIRTALVDLIDDWNVADPRTKGKAKRKLPITDEGMAELPLPMLVAVVGAIATAQRLPKAVARPSARSTRPR